MKLAISQIAWDVEVESTIFKRLKELGVLGLEVVPARLENAKNWTQQGLKPVAMQSLLYGQPEWNLFTESRYEMLVYLQGLIRTADKFNIKNLVFGSPKNRWIPEDLAADKAQKIAQKFFIQLAGMAAEHNVFICLEPNPAVYGCNFLTTTLETVEFLQKINKPHLKLNLDLGAMQLNHEDPTAIIRKAKNFIQHVHISEPYLRPVTTLTDFHTSVVSALQKINYQNYYSIEMKKTTDDSSKNLKNITDALIEATKVFSV